MFGPYQKYVTKWWEIFGHMEEWSMTTIEDYATEEFFYVQDWIDYASGLK